jgi:sugar lactone lactonase YvrE
MFSRADDRKQEPLDPFRARDRSRVKRSVSMRSGVVRKALCAFAGSLILLSIVAAPDALASGGTLRTLAGSPRGLYGFEGDGGLAGSALLRGPTGVAVGPDGSIYVADYHNYRVRRISTEGNITTIAGTGAAGSLGDGGPATSARTVPGGLATDAEGNLYIAECEQERVRKVATDGTITTFAGTGAAGFSGDKGPATSANLHCPIGAAVDSKGDLFIADRENHRVRKVSPGGTITTFAGSGLESPLGEGGPPTSAGMAPEGGAIDAQDNLYIADIGHGPVRKVTSDGSEISTVAGSGTAGPVGDGEPATWAYLSYVGGVALDHEGNIYITGSCRLREVTTDGIIHTVAGTGYCTYSGEGCLATSATFADANTGGGDRRGGRCEQQRHIASYSDNGVLEYEPLGRDQRVEGKVEQRPEQAALRQGVEATA